MFALRVEYLTGQCVSQEFNSRWTVEWPPHPARLFFALACAFFETGEDPAERRFLEWLESQPPPALYATEAERREVTLHYVPVNDARVLARRRQGNPDGVAFEELSVLPDFRQRQARTFPVGIPRERVVYFVWPHGPLEKELWRAATQLCGKVSYLGHSSSLVCVQPVPQGPVANWVPASDGRRDAVFRVCFQGQLEELRRAFKRHLATGIRGQLPAALQGYCRTGSASEGTPAVRSVFGSMVVFRRQEGPTLPLTAIALAVSALRGAALAHSSEPVPEVLSGHSTDGSPSRRPHVAFVALPDVGHRHADGHLVGLAAVLPRELSTEERRAIFQALGSIRRLTMGTVGAWSVVRVAAFAPQWTLREATWQGPAQRWATVTPVLLDRYPKRLFGPEAEAIVARSCERVGLPSPRHVLLSAHSPIPGVPPTFAFLDARGRGDQRPVVHAVLEFDQPVQGPVLLGAGRYRGWGLLRPWPPLTATGSAEVPRP